MAKQYSYTDASGVTHPTAYARLTTIMLRLTTPPSAEFEFSVYADLNKRNAAKQPVGSLRHTVTGSEFSTEYAAHLAGKTLGAIAYDTASVRNLFPPEAVDV